MASETSNWSDLSRGDRTFGHIVRGDLTLDGASHPAWNTLNIGRRMDREKPSGICWRQWTIGDDHVVVSADDLRLLGSI